MFSRLFLCKLDMALRDMQECKAAPPTALSTAAHHLLCCCCCTFSCLFSCKVDMALRDMQERKAASVQSSMSEEDAIGAGAAQASLDLRDTMSEGLRLRSEMQRAVQEERWV
jgi:hypothetical protein